MKKHTNTREYNIQRFLNDQKTSVVDYQLDWPSSLSADNFFKDLFTDRFIHNYTIKHEEDKNNDKYYVTTKQLLCQ